jgi:hypothetical protein
MRPVKWSEHEPFNRPGMRRILDAIKAIEDERPGLLEEASLAAEELAKRRGGDGGRIPE